MIRASLGLYNNINEANIFLNEIDYIANNRVGRRHRKQTGRIRF
ncbi:MAG: hypothetical protein ACLR3X_11690 [Intestinibacter bartlettii]